MQNIQSGKGQHSKKVFPGAAWKWRWVCIFFSKLVTPKKVTMMNLRTWSQWVKLELRVLSIFRVLCLLWVIIFCRPTFNFDASWFSWTRVLQWWRPHHFLPRLRLCPLLSTCVCSHLLHCEHKHGVNAEVHPRSLSCLPLTLAHREELAVLFYFLPNRSLEELYVL